MYYEIRNRDNNEIMAICSDYAHYKVLKRHELSNVDTYIKVIEVDKK